MTLLPLTFLAPAALAVQLAAPAPAIALQFQSAPQLLVALLPQAPLLALRFRAPAELDAALLPVLIGPPGPPGVGGGVGGAEAAPVSRSLMWSAGRLVGVTYADGRSKALTWAGEQLTRVDRITPGQPTQRAELTYNPDGTLAAIDQSVI